MSCTIRRRGCSSVAAAPVQVLARPAVAIVGARACSSYGAQVARLLGRELAAAGLVVTSGLARGIDGEAHRGALEAGGRTIAVLGCGIDRDYPAAHAQLAARVCEDGLVVSEYAPGVEPAPWRFPARNRIIAGLAAATVVVEARERSGSADHRRLRARGGPGGLRGAGRDHLGAVGAARTRFCASARRRSPHRATCSSHSGSSRCPLRRPSSPSTPARVLEALAREPNGVDGLVRETGLGAAAVATALAELELAGLVAEGEGLYRGVRPPG